VGKSWKKTIFRRLILSFVCILLPIYVLSFGIYIWGMNTIQDNIANTMLTQIDYHINSFEDEVRRIRSLQFDIMRDSNLLRLSSIPDSLSEFERTQALLNLQQRVRAIKSSSMYIETVNILIPAVGLNVSAYGSNPLNMEELAIVYDSYLTKSDRVKSTDNDLYLLVVQPFPFASVDAKRYPGYIVTIRLSEKSIEETLKALINSLDKAIVLYSPRDNVRIAVNDDPKFHEDLEKRFLDAQNKQKNISGTILINNRQYLAIYSYSRYLEAILCSYVSTDFLFRPLQTFRWWFIALTVVAITIVVGYSYYLHKFINIPLSILVKSFNKMENGDLDTKIDNTRDNEFGYIYRQFNAMVDNMSNLIDQVYRQKILAQKSEMKQLQSQINPHFLYNSFFTIRVMAQIEDYENLEHFTEQLGEYFQFITRNAADEITLEQEVNHAKIYTSIQANRFSKRIKVEFDDLPQQYARLMVPRLILQPLIENVFEHGLAKKPKEGLLYVNFVATTDRLNIIVEDNGDELDDKKLLEMQRFLEANPNDTEITGILNVYHRLKLKFGQSSGISIERADLGGLRVTMYIDLKEGKYDL